MMIVHGGATLARNFVAYRAQLLDVAERILRCRRRAEDIVQDAFLKVIEHADSEAVRRPVAYLFSVVRNLAIDQYRRSSFEYRLFASEECGWEVAAPNHAVEASLWSSQCLRRIDRALSELPERTRAAFELHRMQGLTQRDVAKRLCISPTLVNFMIRDAMSHCRRALEQLDGMQPDTPAEQTSRAQWHTAQSRQWGGPVSQRGDVEDQRAEFCGYQFVAEPQREAA